MPNEKGETRRERNEVMGQDTPEFKIPQTGNYLWNIFFEMCESVGRIKNGMCYPIPPSEFKAYFELTETIVYPHEYGILRNMDSVFVIEMNKELQDFQSRQREEHKRELEQSRKK